MNFSPYQPPPDVPSEPTGSSAAKKGKGKSKRPWLETETSYNNSYQAGGAVSDPTSVNQALTNDPEAQAYSYGNGGDYQGHAGPSEERVNAWESRFGWRIDLMAAAAYLGGPVTALIFLILETQNDYVRFHAYQSALLTTPIVVFLLITNLLIPFPAFLRSIIIIAGIGATLYAAYRAWKDAQEGLSRYWLPYIGELSERWVNEE